MSYFSSLLTQTTSRVASIRQNIFTSEADGDTEDDTHICRVLRHYYTEKGRPFPGWLPPDPKAPPPIVVQPVYNNPVGAGYGGMNSQGGGLSSLWDSQPATRGAPQSLRTASPALQRPSREPYNRSQTASVEPTIQARPLPSQRAGSYQSAGRGDAPAGAAGAGSASDKLKARLWGAARSASPSSMANTAGSAMEQHRTNSFGSSRSDAGGGGQQYNSAPRGQQDGRRMGLPSGPRSGGGLPTNGPRGYR